MPRNASTSRDMNLKRFNQQVKLLMLRSGGFKKKTLDKIVICKLRSYYGDRETKNYVEKKLIPLPSQLLKTQTINKHPLFEFKPEWLESSTSPDSEIGTVKQIPWKQVALIIMLRNFIQYPSANSYGTCSSLLDLVARAVECKKKETETWNDEEDDDFIFQTEFEQLEKFYLSRVANKVLRHLGVKKEDLEPFDSALKLQIENFEG